MTPGEEHVFMLSLYRQPNLLSKWFTVDVDSARANVGNVANVSDISAASIFTVEVSRQCDLCILSYVRCK
jgi:hypothetical protein